MLAVLYLSLVLNHTANLNGHFEKIKSDVVLFTVLIRFGLLWLE